MSWYKKAQAFTPIEMSDRNIINEKIRYLEHVNEQLKRLSKVIFQDGTYAKNTNMKLATDKKLSAYESIQSLLLQADKIALDSPWKFSGICLDVVDEIDKKVASLKKQRKELIEVTLPNKMKGWVNKNGR